MMVKYVPTSAQTKNEIRSRMHSGEIFYSADGKQMFYIHDTNIPVSAQAFMHLNKITCSQCGLDFDGLSSQLMLSIFHETIETSDKTNDIRYEYHKVHQSLTDIIANMFRDMEFYDTDRNVYFYRDSAFKKHTKHTKELFDIRSIDLNDLYIRREADITSRIADVCMKNRVSLDVCPMKDNNKIQDKFWKDLSEMIQKYYE